MRKKRGRGGREKKGRGGREGRREGREGGRKGRSREKGYDGPLVHTDT